MPDLTQAREYYEQARRQGQRARDNAALALHSLDEVRKDVRILAEVRLGVVEIPLYRVVGTQSAMRGEAFGPGFMPAQDTDTEFARKWMNVCLYHLQDGVSDPLKVYEYLGRYYVIEGNKRVSVMKFFDVFSARAEVIRLIPERIEDHGEIEAFHVWLEYMKTGVFPNLYMTYPFCYRRLQIIRRRLEHQGVKDFPTPAEGNEILSRFEAAYAPYCAQQTMPYYGDAFLEYLQVFGLLKAETPISEISEQIRTILPQIQYTVRQDQSELLLEDEDSKPSFLRRILPKKQPLIVFAFGDNLDNNEWLAMHEAARRELQDAFGNRVRTETIPDLTAENAYEMLSAAAEGADILFVPSAWLMDTALRVSLENPDCIVMQYSMSTPHHRLHTYFSRYYEAVYLCGMLAAMLSTTNTVGYLTPSLKLRGSTLDLNAFALGVRAMRPQMRVCMAEITRPLDKKQAALGAQILHKEGADLAIFQNFMRGELEKPANTFSFLARMDAAGQPVEYLGAPIWNWEPFYAHIANEYLSGTLTPGIRPRSYWWGLDSSILNLHMNQELVPVEVHRLVSHMKHDMMRGEWAAFRGPLYDRNGEMQLEADRQWEPEDMLYMHWVLDFVERIEIPEEE